VGGDMVKQKIIDTRFGRVKCFISGQGEEYIVMLQGWATLHSLYDHIVGSLAEKYTVIFPALPGFGESAEPSEAMSVSDYAELINELLEALGIKRAHFFCHSFGGRIFFKLCSLDLVAVTPISVVLTDVAGIMPKKTLLKKLRIRAYKIGKRVLKTKLCRFFFPDALETLRERNGSDDYNSATPIMRATLVKAVNEDLSHLFRLVNAPTLILWGKYDSAVPLSDAYVIESAIEDSAVIVFENSDHFPFITEKARFIAVLRSFFKID
jgi:pimeloyl-ACP methyl ester carboxylesterase